VAQARLSVRKIREVLRLKNEARLSDRQIAAVLGSARSTVQECLRRARTAGLSWPLPDLDEDELHERPLSAHPERAALSDAGLRSDPTGAGDQGRNTAAAVARVQGPNIRRAVSTARSAATTTPGWVGRTRVMRFEHVPGDKAFVDYAGKTMAVVDRHSGEIQVAQVFVAALGASHYTYVEATPHPDGGRLARSSRALARVLRRGTSGDRPG